MILRLVRENRSWGYDQSHGVPTYFGGRLIVRDLELMGLLDRQIAELDEQIREATEPLLLELKRLQSIPGVKSITAQEFSAEMGPDMGRFGSAKRLSSWAGVAPGNNESVGKRRKGRTGKSDRYLRRVLAQCAWAARCSPLETTSATSSPRGRPRRATVAVQRPSKYLTIYSGTFWLLISLGISWHIPEKMVQNFRPGT